MENYQQSDLTSQRPQPEKDEFTKSIERYTASLTSSAYLGIAVAAMGFSLLC